MAKILIMAGGTGGHIFPALPVAEILRRNGHEIFWMGTRNGLETKLLPEAALYTVDFTGVRKKGLKMLFTTPMALLRAIVQASKVFKSIQPNVVLGMGGYTALPGGITAFLRGIPLIIHEQNSIAGLSNRVLARLAKKILLGYPNTLKGGIWVGNPVRTTIVPNEERGHRQGPLRILVLGGSQGARALNETIPRALAQMQAHVFIRHQCGHAHVEKTKALYKNLQLDVEVVPFLEHIEDAYAWCDLAICRAGAMTLAELAQAGVPAILVPYPFAVDDHQTKNALFYARSGGALLIAEKDLTPESLTTTLTQLDRAKLKAMSKMMRQQAKTDAATTMATMIMEIAHAA